MCGTYYVRYYFEPSEFIRDLSRTIRSLPLSAQYRLLLKHSPAHFVRWLPEVSSVTRLNRSCRRSTFKLPGFSARLEAARIAGTARRSLYNKFSFQTATTFILNVFLSREAFPRNRIIRYKAQSIKLFQFCSPGRSEICGRFLVADFLSINSQMNGQMIAQ